MVVSMYGVSDERNFKEKFLVIVSTVYMFMYGFRIESYLDTLIIIQSQVKKDGVHGERNKCPSLGALPWPNMVDGLILCVVT